MDNIYLYIESQNDASIGEQKNRYDTPFQKVSNTAYEEIKRECEKFGINFEFLTNKQLQPDDIVIVSNITPFNRGPLKTNLIISKNRISNRNSGFRNLGKLIAKNKDTRFVPYLWESSIAEVCNWDFIKHKKHEFIFTWDTNLINSYPKKYFLLNLQAGPLEFPTKDISLKKQSFKDRSKFISTISNAKGLLSNDTGYKARVDIANWYGINRENEFSLFGGGWSDVLSFGDVKRKNSRLPPEIRRNIKNVYGGTIEHKSSVISESKFYLCIENCITQSGYVTEKIFDALIHGAVPIYLGATDIQRFIPTDCFIDLRSFNGSIANLHSYLSKMNEDQWNAMVEASNDFLFSESSNINRYSPLGIASQLNELNRCLKSYG